MILVQYQNHWFLSPGISHELKVRVLRCLATMPHPADFQPIDSNRIVLQGTVPLSASSLVAYSELRYHGLRVTPLHWKHVGQGPWIVCSYIPQSADAFTDEYFSKYAPDLTAQDFVAKVMISDNWVRTDMYEYEKAVHVDELEKIES